MASEDKELGRLISVHVIAPAYVQRAVILAVLAFMFFLTMMFAFYVRQHILYFFLSTAFLIIYLITMFSIVMQRKANVEVYENGFRHRKTSVLWDEIDGVNGKGEIKIATGKTVSIPATINNLEKLIAEIKDRAGREGPSAPKRSS